MLSSLPKRVDKGLPRELKPDDTDVLKLNFGRKDFQCYILQDKVISKQIAKFFCTLK
jgi:hypothetical protein